MAKKTYPTAEFIRQILDYNPKTGELFWKARKAEMFQVVTDTPEKACKTWNTQFAGKRVGTRHTLGYLRVSIYDVSYYCHRLAWIHFYGFEPRGQIDHANGDKTDNRITNLRDANNQQNSANKRVLANNILGVKNVRRTDEGRFRSTIYVDSAPIHLGIFDTIEEASAAYAKAARKHFGKFARTS